MHSKLHFKKKWLNQHYELVTENSDECDAYGKSAECDIYGKSDKYDLNGKSDVCDKYAKSDKYDLNGKSDECNVNGESDGCDEYGKSDAYVVCEKSDVYGKSVACDTYSSTQDDIDADNTYFKYKIPDKSCNANGISDFYSNDASKITYSCAICGKTFSQRFNLEVHITIDHINDRPYYYGKNRKESTTSSATKRTLKKPYPNPTKERPYSCKICSKTFICKKRFDQHYDQHLTKKDVNVCDICGEIYAKKNLFTIHYRTHKMVSVEQMISKARQSQSNSNLMSHYSQKMISLMSYVCDKVFTGKNAYTMHIPIH